MKRRCVDHFISFSSQQVVVTTESEEASHFIREMYEHMMSDRAGNVVGEVAVRVTEGIFEVVRSGEAALSAAELPALFAQITDDVLSEFIQARSDLLWFHAGAVKKQEQTVLIAAASGNGKSTITTQLVERGWQYMSDDVAPVEIETLKILAYPQRPLRRKFPGSFVERGRIGSLQREPVPVDPGDVYLGETRLTTIIFPEFGPYVTPRLSGLSQGDGAIQLLRHIRNFPTHREAAIGAVAAIARASELLQFHYGDPGHASVLFGQ